MSHQYLADLLSTAQNIDRRFQLSKTVEVIDKQTNDQPVFRCKLPREPPRNTDIAKIVNDATKNVAGITGLGQFGVGVSGGGASTVARAAR